MRGIISDQDLIYQIIREKTVLSKRNEVILRIGDQIDMDKIVKEICMRFCDFDHDHLFKSWGILPEDKRT
jgi:hypothetical protein